MGLIIFFKIVLFYFEVATFSSIALRAFACALRLSPHVASRPQQWGWRGGGVGGRKLAALFRDGWEGGLDRHEEQR